MKPKPKLLHFALGNHNVGLWRSFEKEFETCHYNWLPYQNDPQKINSDILKIHSQFKPDVVFMQIQAPEILTLATARQMTKTSITLNWTGDVRYPLPEWYKELGKVITLSLFSNMFDVEQMKKANIPADFLQVGFDPNIFTPTGRRVPTPSVVFMGSNYLGANQSFPLSNLRYEMVIRLKQAFANNFTAFGSNWNKVDPTSRFLNLQEEATAYRSSDIAINLSHFDYGRYSSDRMFRLMGAGGFCLTHKFKNVDIDFDVDHHISTWSTIEELTDKIKYFQSNPYAREQIRMNGCKFVREYCTWDCRMKELKTLIDL